MLRMSTRPPEVARDDDEQAVRIEDSPWRRRQKEIWVAGNWPAAVKATDLPHACDSRQVDRDDPGIQAMTWWGLIRRSVAKTGEQQHRGDHE